MGSEGSSRKKEVVLAPCGCWCVSYPFFCLLPSCPLSEASGLPAGWRHNLSGGPGELGLGWVMTSLPLTCSFRCGAGSHSIQMANCLVPVSANHSDSLSLLKTRSLFKDLMVSKINLASCVIPLPLCPSPSPLHLPAPGWNFLLQKAHVHSAGHSGERWAAPLSPQGPRVPAECAVWGRRKQVARAGVHGSFIFHHPACSRPPRAGLPDTPRSRPPRSSHLHCFVYKLPKVLCVSQPLYGNLQVH